MFRVYKFLNIKQPMFRERIEGRFGIRAKFIILVSLLLSVCTAVSGGILIYHTVNSLKDVVIQKGILLAKKVAYDSIYGVTIGDKVILDNIIKEVRNDPDIVYTVILDKQGVVLAHTRKEEVGKVFNDSLTVKLLSEKGATSEKQIVEKGETLFDVWAPVPLEDSSGGLVLVRLSLKRVMESINKVIWIGLGSTIIIIFFGSLLSYFFVEAMIKPIEEMARAADDIAKGDFTPRFDIASKDEIGRLSSSFNSMLISMEKKDDDLRQNIRDLAILNTTAMLVSQSLDLREILNGVLEKALEITGMDAGWIYLFDEKNDLFKVAAHRGVSDDFIAEIDGLAVGEGIAGRVGSSGEVIEIDDISTDERLTRSAVKKRGFKGFISIPIKSREKVIGALNIASLTKHNSGIKEVDLLKGMGNQAGMAITNSGLYEELRLKIEELKSAQDQLIQSAKLAAIGELAAHIAHEINNPLTGILGYASLLIENETDQASINYLEIIEREALRTREIVKKLLDFARQTEPKMDRVNINHVIKEALSLVVMPATASNIQIVEEYSKKLPDILVDVSQIEQVFINLISNSMDAMPNGGRLTVRSYPAGKYVVVSISDNGAGIPAEILPMIFEPFFTTKGKISGAGLGLSVSLGIVERHGGKIEVESLIGKGTTFTVSLPIAEAKV